MSSTLGARCTGKQLSLGNAAAAKAARLWGPQVDARDIRWYCYCVLSNFIPGVLSLSHLVGVVIYFLRETYKSTRGDLYHPWSPAVTWCCALLVFTAQPDGHAVTRKSVWGHILTQLLVALMVLIGYQEFLTIYLSTNFCYFLYASCYDWQYNESRYQMHSLLRCLIGLLVARISALSTFRLFIGVDKVVTVSTGG